jgi:hypothetical protein
MVESYGPEPVGDAAWPLHVLALTQRTRLTRHRREALALEADDIVSASPGCSWIVACSGKRS